MTIDMSSSDVNLVAGQSYFVLLTVATPNAGFPRYSEWWIDTGTMGFPEQPIFSPDGGSSWQVTGVPLADQIPFTITGQAVPEPCSAILLASGLVVLVHVGLRRGASRSR